MMRRIFLVNRWLMVAVLFAALGFASVVLARGA